MKKKIEKMYVSVLDSCVHTQYHRFAADGDNDDDDKINYCHFCLQFRQCNRRARNIVTAPLFEEKKVTEYVLSALQLLYVRFKGIWANFTNIYTHIPFTNAVRSMIRCVT